MLYNKKFLIFKELNKGYSLNGKSVNGILKAECENDQTTMSISLIGFSALTEGKYFAVTNLSGNVFAYDLGTAPVAFSYTEKVKLKDGDCACLIAHVFDEITPVAIAASENSEFSAMKLAEYLNREIKNEKTVETQNSKETDIQVQTPAYDDETVATENYYLYDNEETKNERTVFKKNVGTDNESESQKNGEEKNFEMFKNETGFTVDEENAAFKIKENLEKLFSSYPEDFSLSKTLPHSKWVKINYSDDGYYLVGAIYKNDEPEYVCYGIPAKFNEKPPEELNGICCFIPLSVFDMQGDGYFVIFQSAVTGKCIHMQKE